MRDSFQRFNDTMAAERRARKKGTTLFPVRTFNVKKIGHLIPVPEMAKDEVRPMSLRQIKKREPDAMKDDTKQYGKSPDGKPEVKTWWAYLSSPKTPQRMSRVVIGE